MTEGTGSGKKNGRLELHVRESGFPVNVYIYIVKPMNILVTVNGLGKDNVP